MTAPLTTAPIAAPVRLQGSPRDMVWGVPQTAGRYAGMRIGEIWFDARPLLVKWIATGEKLSVQVHPGDAYAAQHEAARGINGKTEIWQIMEAAPGARLALGFQQPMTRDEVRTAALDGSLEQKLNWIEVRRGDTIFVPAGTVHAMGPGLQLWEVQQYSDVTYRLFDYGRGRELHLERGLDVIHDETGLAPGAGIVALPFACPYFQVEEIAASMEPADAPEVWRTVDGLELRKNSKCLRVKP